MRAVSSSEEEFVRQLRKQGIEAIFRRTEEGRIYGATFIDRTERLAVNGSRLGREFAARTWNEWPDGFRPEPVSDTVPAQEQSGCPNFRMEEVSFGIPQQPPSLFEELLSAGAETFGELFEPLPPRHEEYIDPAFRLDYKKRKKKKRKHIKL